MAMRFSPSRNVPTKRDGAVVASDAVVVASVEASADVAAAEDVEASEDVAAASEDAEVEVVVSSTEAGGATSGTRGGVKTGV